MRVFISWSGEQSHQVALALKEWLPDVVQTLETWVSTSDIDKGEQWFSAISDSLVKAEGMGVFCLTPDNLKAPWLAYEAGALASHDRARVATFLYGVRAAEVAPPLGLFQGTVASSKADVLLLVKTMNSRLPSPLHENRLEKAFNTHWPSLESQLSAIPPAEPSQQKNSEQAPQNILNEILAVVRRIEKDGAWRWDGGNLLNPPYGPTGPGAGASNLGLLAELPASDLDSAGEGLNKLAQLLIKQKTVESEEAQARHRRLLAAALIDKKKSP